MSLGFTNQVFTLAQMVEAMRKSYADGQADGYSLPPFTTQPWAIEEIALIVCNVAELPMMDVLASIQKLEEWRSSQRDHP